MLLVRRSSLTLLVMMVVSNSWVRAATSYRLGVRWGSGGRRGGLTPRPGSRPGDWRRGESGEGERSEGRGDSVRDLKESTESPGILGLTLVILL